MIKKIIPLLFLTLACSQRATVSTSPQGNELGSGGYGVEGTDGRYELFDFYENGGLVPDADDKGQFLYPNDWESRISTSIPTASASEKKEILRIFLNRLYIVNEQMRRDQVEGDFAERMLDQTSKLKWKLVTSELHAERDVWSLMESSLMKYLVRPLKDRGGKLIPLGERKGLVVKVHKRNFENLKDLDQKVGFFYHEIFGSLLDEKYKSTLESFPNKEEKYFVSFKARYFVRVMYAERAPTAELSELLAKD